LEADLLGKPLDPTRAADKAASHGGVFRARDGIEAPGWYRVKVLPSLVRSAVRALQAQA
jgi:carbon-monoxide dehydrogenase medium subunit